MDKFTNTNRYTVKLGVYQMQMNLQDPNQKQRYRAMIVGVDERDKANVSASRSLANSPFVLLDGKQKQAAFEADTPNRYYQLIAKFDEEHQKFCGEFLQTFCDLKPNSGIYDLYEIFTALNKQALPDTRTLANTLDRLGKYRAVNTGIYREIYKRVNAEVSRFMQEDFSCALKIVNWLQTASVITGDTSAKKRLSEIVCKEFADNIFGKTDNAAKRSYWAQIKSTGFKMDAARVISDMKIINDNLSKLHAFAPADFAVFVAVYLDSASIIGSVEQQYLKAVIKLGIKICCKNDDTNTLQEIFSTPQIKNIDSQEFLFELIKGEDKKIGEFVIKFIIDRDASIFASDDSTRSFCKKLKDEGLENLSGSALIKRAGVLNKTSEIERFIDTVQNMNFIGEDALAKVFELLDAKIDMSNNALVELLQTQKPRGTKCENSAHFTALNILSGNRRKQSLTEAFGDLTSQGFPSVTDKDYIEKFAEGLIKTGMNEEEQSFILNILFRAPKGYFSAYVTKLVCAAAKNQDKWNILLKFASGSGNKQIDDDIVQALAGSKQNEKTLTALGSLLKDENSLEYYKSIDNKAREIISSQKNKSGIGKLFGGR
jgi:hypothetical protein